MNRDPTASFKDHFSTTATDYAQARPQYPPALFDWIASIAPARDMAWEAGCGSGQASRDLATRFARVHATDPSAAQVALAPAIANVAFAVEPGERCSLADASVDAVCVAQALHWFDHDAFFAECGRMLRPGGVLAAWGYQDIVVPPEIAAANRALQDAIGPYWPPERSDVDAAKPPVPTRSLRTRMPSPRPGAIRRRRGRCAGRFSPMPAANRPCRSAGGMLCSRWPCSPGC